MLLDMKMNKSKTKMKMADDIQSVNTTQIVKFESYVYLGRDTAP